MSKSKLQIKRVTLDQQVADVLRQEIVQKHRPGDKLDTVLDLAKRFEVSKAVISQAIVILAREGLLDRRHGSGLFVKDARAAKLVGILLDPDIAHPRTSHFPLKVAQLLRQFFAGHGLRTRLYMGFREPDNDDPKLTCPEFLPDVLAHKLSGVAVVSTRVHEEWLEPLEQQGVPVVGARMDHSCPKSCDYELLAREGVRRLVRQGCRKIAAIGGLGDAAEGGPLEAFRSELRVQSIPVIESWIRGDLQQNIAGAGWNEFREIWMARGEKPDGLLLMDDTLLRDVSIAIMELGIRVPEQLRIVSHANKGADMFIPFPITLAQVDPQLHAEIMGTKLLQMLNTGAVAQPQVITPFEWIEAGQTYSGRSKVSAPEEGRLRVEG